MDALAAHIQFEIQKGITTQMEMSEELYQRKLIIPPLGKTHNALCLRESRHRILCAQWFVALPEESQLGRRNVGRTWRLECQDTEKQNQASLDRKEETSIVRAIQHFSEPYGLKVYSQTPT